VARTAAAVPGRPAPLVISPTVRIWVLTVSALATLAVIGLDDAVAGAAHARTHASGAKSHQSTPVTVPLPGADEASVTVLTLTAKASPAQSGLPEPHTLNEAELPQGVRAVAAFATPSGSKHKTTVKAYVAINNLGAATAASTAPPSSGLPVDLKIVWDGHYRYTAANTEEWRIPRDCAKIIALGNSVDEIRKKRFLEKERGERVKSNNYYVIPLRGKNIQPSFPEEILDHIAARCPGGEEVDIGEA